MRKLFGSLLKYFFFRPPYVKYSVQTVYKALQGCYYLHEAKIDGNWAEEIDYLSDLITRIQTSDGGFDVRYNYQFAHGLLHKKGQALACETSALLVLRLSNPTDHSSKIEDTLNRGINWIKTNSFKLDSEKYSIPYCPKASGKTLIINGVSFTAATLGVICKPSDEASANIYLGMLSFLDEEMMEEKGTPGRFWPYFEDSCSREFIKDYERTDYYHLAQQVENHSIAQKKNPHDIQLRMIRDAADFLVYIHFKYSLIPYDNSNYFGGMIHTWGLSSVIPAMLEASELLPEKSKVYQQVAKDTLDWLIQYAWNGTHFYDILTPDGRAVSDDYMVRSDAWCFQALARYTKFEGHGPWTEIALSCMKKLQDNNYSGLEKHAKTRFQFWLEKFQRK